MSLKNVRANPNPNKRTDLWEKRTDVISPWRSSESFTENVRFKRTDILRRSFGTSNNSLFKNVRLWKRMVQTNSMNV